MKNRLLLGGLMLVALTFSCATTHAMDLKDPVVVSINENVQRDIDTIALTAVALDAPAVVIVDETATFISFNFGIRSAVTQDTLHKDPARNISQSNIIYKLIDTNFADSGTAFTVRTLLKFKAAGLMQLKTHDILLLDPGWIRSNSLS